MHLSLLSTLLLITSCSLFTSRPALSPSQELSRLRLEKKLPALAAAASVNGEIIFIEAQGLRKSGSPISVTVSDTFHLGSCSKAMTATLVALMIEEGHFDWRTPLSMLLPKLNLHEDFKDITIEQLLSHHAGVAVNPVPSFTKVLKKLSVMKARKQFSQSVLSQKATYSKDEYHYSNAGYIILGHLLEEQSGKSWEDLMKAKIFKPLAMNSCGFGPTSSSKEKHPTQPWGHKMINNKMTPLQVDNPAFFGPAATVHCSLRDWHHFLLMHMNGYNQHDSFLKTTSFHKLHSTPKANDTYTFGGWIRIKREWGKGDVLTHGGSNVFNAASTWIAPHIKMILMNATNSGKTESFQAIDEMSAVLIKNQMPD